MAASIIFIAFMAFLAASGIAAALGYLPDTRDPDYGVGPVIRRHPSATKVTAPPATDR